MRSLRQIPGAVRCLRNSLQCLHGSQRQRRGQIAGNRRVQGSHAPQPRNYPVRPPRPPSKPLSPSANAASGKESGPRPVPVQSSPGNLKTVPGLAAERLAITGIPKQLGGRGPRKLPPSTEYIGVCEEPWMTQRIRYKIKFHQDGKVSGMCSSDSGQSFRVSGQYDAAKGLYRWAEMSDDSTDYKSVLADPLAYIESLAKSSSVHVEVEMKIQDSKMLEGQYVTTTGSHGNLTLRTK